MIILYFCLLCFLICLLYFKNKDKYLNKTIILKNKKIKNKNKNKEIQTIEHLDLYKSDNKLYIKNNIKLNDYNIEVDRPLYSYSNYKNDKNIDFNNLDEELINNAYDKLVDDNRIQNINYDNLTFYNSNDDYYNIVNNDNYGYTNFMTYKNDLKIN
jgi:hypothetical protein